MQAEHDPILVQDSLPYGADNMDTLEMPDKDIQVIADRLNKEIPEEPNLESSPGSLASCLSFVVHCLFEKLLR